VPDTVYERGFDSFSVPDTATIIEQSVCKLRNAIMQGELRPGQKLIEAELCRTLDISRASLREALRILETEKLIELVPNRGPSVAKLGYDDVEAIHEVWALLTGEAIADFTRVAKERHIVELQKALDALKASIVSNRPLDQLAATNAFFMSVMLKCGNSILTETVISLVSRVNFLRAQALLHQGWGVVYAAEIEDILEAIRAGNPDVARSATRKHIASACAAAKQLALAPDLGSAPKKGTARAERQPPKRASATKKPAEALAKPRAAAKAVKPPARKAGTAARAAKPARATRREQA
jgi:DNA-binding GntR family transcriptional regulator